MTTEEKKWTKEPLKRYEPHIDMHDNPDMKASNDGAYVLYSDVTAELARLRECEDRLNDCEAMMSAIDLGHQKPEGFSICLDEARSALSRGGKEGE